MTLFISDVLTLQWGCRLFTTDVWTLQWHCSLQRSEHCSDTVHYRCLNTAVTLFTTEVWTLQWHCSLKILNHCSDTVHYGCLNYCSMTLFTTDVWTLQWHCSLQISERQPPVLEGGVGGVSALFPALLRPSASGHRWDCGHHLYLHCTIQS